MPLAILSFVLTVIYVPGIASAAQAPRWAVIACMALLLFRQKIRMTPAHWLGLGFLAYAALSLWWTFIFDDGVLEFATMAMLIVPFCLGAEAEELAPVYWAMAAGVGINAGMQWFQGQNIHALVEQTVAPGGLFANKNFVGEIAAMVLIACIAKEVMPSDHSNPRTTDAWPRWRWLLLAGPALALVLSGSRASWLAVGITAVVALIRWRPMLAIVAVGAVFAGAFLIAAEPGAADTLMQRVGILRDTIPQLTWTGHGVGSYYSLYPSFAKYLNPIAVRSDHAHNDLVELAFEFGAAASLLYGVAIYALAAPFRAETAILVCFLAIGLFGFPLYNPATGFLAALVAGHLCGLRHRLLRPVAGGRRDAGDRLADAAEAGGEHGHAPAGGVVVSLRSPPATRPG
ncbi:MAG TPA: O-antigen ligase family protein [Candidatus Cybelea sp.]|nr:O-antigen ligase family protein [Candidatus Cybelea sp.]